MLAKNQSCFILAGERSGEEHALAFLPRLKELCPHVEFFGVGGEQMRKHGVELIYHWSEFSSWGLVDVLKKIVFYAFAYRKILKVIKQRDTKHAILIDFQGLNLKLAKRLSKRGVQVFYYVAPQAWAWKPWRAKALARSVEILYVLLPFEVEWFKARGVKQTVQVTHPLLETYERSLEDLVKKTNVNLASDEGEILLLPGSRRSEIDILLPYFRELIELLRDLNPRLNFHLLMVERFEEQDYKKRLGPQAHSIQFWEAKDTAEILTHANFAFAASGTVTLLCALFQIPTVVAYELSPINDWAFRNFVPYRGPYSLANIVWSRFIFAEVTGENLSALALFEAARPLLCSAELFSKEVQLLRQTKELVKAPSLDVGESMAKLMSERHNNRQ